MQNYPEKELILRLKAGDKTAFEQLYDSYSASLYGVILRMVKDEMVAEDLMQECFVKIWLSFPQYDSNKGRLFTWLVTIARHVAIDITRSRAYRKSLRTQNLDIFFDVGLEQTNTFKPEHIGVKELLATLAKDQRKVVDLLYFEGYSHAEAAQELEIPLGTVKTRVRYALQKLRKLMVEPLVSAA